MKRSRLILIVILLLIMLIGCNQAKQQNEIKPMDKAPDSLKQLSTGIVDMLKSLGDIERLSLSIPLKDKEKEAGEKEAAEGSDSQDSSSSGEEEQGGEKKQEQSSQGSQGSESESGGSQGGSKEESTKSPEEKKDEQIKALWDTIEKKLEEIHPQWNSFELEGQKKGATNESRDKFELAFNKMTKAIEVKSILEIYDYASQSLRNLKPFYDLYLDDIGGDVSVIQHSAYQAYIRAIQGDIEGAVTILSDKEENINKIRLKMTKDEEKDAIEKISLALTDFKDSLPEKSRRLFMIKKDMIIENLKALEK